MTVRLSPSARQQFLDTAGNPYVGAKLFTYVAGTSTKQATYTTSIGDIANTNPVVLDAAGRTPSGLWLTEGADYKFVLAPAFDTDPPASAIYTEDGIKGVNDTAVLSASVSDNAAAIATIQGLQASAMINLASYDPVGDGVTSDQTAVEAAVAAAYERGAPLYWPDGTYLTTASIPNFHDVKHYGPGIVKRGTGLFYVEPRGKQANTIYIATTGVSTDDGLSASQPVATFQNAFDAVKNYGPVLQGVWTIDAAAGTYSGATVQTLNGIKSLERVIIKGPTVAHPDVPTCIIDGGSTGSNYAHGMSCDGAGLKVYVKYIKFIGFSGDNAGNSRGALLFDNDCDAATDNVHVTGSTWFGIYVSRRSSARIGGGILDGCRNGVNTDGAKATVGYGATSLATGTIVKNCTESGIYWARGTDGHTDYVAFEDNAVGLVVDTNSRTDSVGCNFKRNTVGVSTRTGGLFGDNPYVPCEFNIGTVDDNTTTFEFAAYSGETTEGSAAQSMLRVGYDRTTRTVTGTAVTTLATPYTIQAGRMQGDGKSCTVEVFGTYTVTAGSTLTVAFGGKPLTLTVPAAASNVTFRFKVDLVDVEGGMRAFGTLAAGLNGSRLGVASIALDNTIDNAVTVECALAGADDTISIYRTDVHITG